MLMNFEIWKRFIKERDEFLKTEDPDIRKVIEDVRNNIGSNNESLTLNLIRKCPYRKVVNMMKKQKLQQKI